MCLLALRVHASDSLVGRVVDEQRQPVSFASVYVENNPMQGTVTDTEGIFVLDSIAQHDKIIVSFIGFRTLEMRFKKIPTDTILVQMQEQPILLSETQVVKEKKISKQPLVTHDPVYEVQGSQVITADDIVIEDL